MLKVNDSGAYKDIHELYKKNSSSGYDYIGELYKSDGNGGYSHVFSAGYDTEVTGNPLTMDVSRAKPISYELSGNAKRTIEISSVEYIIPDTITLYTSVDDTDGNTYTPTGYVYPALQGSTFGLYHFDTGVFDSTTSSSATFIQGSGVAGPEPSTLIEGVKGVGDISKNLFDITTAKDGYFVRAGNATTENPLGSEGASSTWSCSDYIPVSPSTTYTVTYPYYQSATAAGLVYFSDKTVASAISGVTTGTQASAVYTFTTPATCNYVRFSWNHTQGSNCQLETGSSSTTIVPHYQFPLTHPQNCGMVDLGTLTWEYNGTRFKASLSGLKYQTSVSLSPNMYCNGLTVMSQNAYDTSDNCITTSNASELLLAKCSAYTDATSFKSAMSSVYLYYQRQSDDTWQSPTTYNIYDDSQLYKIGTYPDTIKSDGTRTNDVSIKVFDGTESWTGSSYFALDISEMIDSMYGQYICSHFTTRLGGGDRTRDIQFGASNTTLYIFEYTSYPSGVTDLATWKAYLAAQYAAGTPVTIYYPLATPTTETITTPTITNAKGTDYLECNTEIPVSELSATYRRKYKLTT